MDFFALQSHFISLVFRASKGILNAFCFCFCVIPSQSVPFITNFDMIGVGLASRWEGRSQSKEAIGGEGFQEGPEKCFHLAIGVVNSLKIYISVLLAKSVLCKLTFALTNFSILSGSLDSQGQSFRSSKTKRVTPVELNNRARRKELQRKEAEAKKKNENSCSSVYFPSVIGFLAAHCIWNGEIKPLLEFDESKTDATSQEEAYDALDPTGNITIKWDDPTVVDLLPGTPYNQLIANCCKGGVMNSWVQEPANAASSFQSSLLASHRSDMECYMHIFIVPGSEDTYIETSPYLASAVSGPGKRGLTKILIYNARGAGSSSFPQYIANQYYRESPHLTIVTETRLSGRAAKRVRDSLTFDHTESIDASGFCGGAWLLWNESDSELEILSKGPFGLRADIEPMDKDLSDE
ncbi:Glycosyl-phosphatidyl inositol-anchored, plant [Corchorus capsularis]|uniref:Glycosyl-phosphatidyl inositol-anchored, plant n=1 Tax=Corchorus capsularis TaxID=210143 RepID=A0A1R3GJ83_COCAP|nr:Glycosyl-phosphatidyl inositol-anchored, plant [Corchorus capsularis]